MKEKETKIIYYKLCPNCNFFCGGNEIDKYCSICGSELKSECPACQQKYDNPYAKFCKKCGIANRIINSTKDKINF
ncbi:MAG: hypothetical protein WC055_15685 [Melioribacteraceae bacterium]